MTSPTTHVIDMIVARCDASETTPDPELWMKAAEGDERAFAALFQRYRDHVLHVAWNTTHNRNVSEDGTSGVFLELWRLRARVRIVNESLLPWLLTVTRNVCRNLTRTERRYARLQAELIAMPDVDNRSTSTYEGMEVHFAAVKIDRALRDLSPLDQQVVALCLIDGHTIASAAAHLSIPVGTAKSRLSRARSRLRSQLERDY